MGESSSIEWTDATWNPVRGCTKVSAGCKNCYAETFMERFRGAKPRGDKPHPFVDGFDLRLVPEALDLPVRWTRPRMIFVNSMSDLFHFDVPDDYIRQVFDVMRRCPQHTFQVLTKRAERLVERSVRLDLPANLWVGVSVEDQRVEDRIRYLREVRGASVRFLSVEPLIGPLDLRGRLKSPSLDEGGIDWVIAGGESGPRARPMDPSWVRAVRDACVEANVPFFFKQWGGTNKKATGRELDGRTWDEMPRGFVRP